MNLTVGITYHNEKELLTEALHSLFSQEKLPDEVLIFDDASQESPARYLGSFADNVKILRGEENRGPSFGRNEILRAARGKYIHFHDADDLFHSNWTQEVGKLLGLCDVIFTEIPSLRDGKPYGHHILGLEKLHCDPDLLRFSLRHFLLVPSGTYRTDLLKELGGYRLDLWQSEDYDFHVRLAMRKVSYRTILEPLVILRIRPDSRSQNLLETRLSALQAVERFQNEIPQAYYDDLAEMAAFLGSELFRLGSVAEARRAFSLARHLGSPVYSHQNSLYRKLAQNLHPELAEWVGLVYRTIIPARLRHKMREHIS